MDALIHPLSRVRLDAVGALSLEPIAHRYALRQVLFFDDEAEVRVLAARRLAEVRDARTLSWLLEVLDDRLAIVRDAAWHALGKFGSDAVVEAALSAVEEDEIWWVRRAAVRSAVAARGEGAVGVLLIAFGDPFWRVRHAAAQAAVALGPGLRAKVAGAPEGIRKWLEQGWGGSTSFTARAVERSPRVAVDDDPAVTTAQLENDRGVNLSTAALVELLGDPHEALRQVTRRILIERKDPQTARLALRWLDDVRVPQAAAEARTLLARIDGDALAGQILQEDARPGALRWAAGLAPESPACDRHFHSPDPRVRAAVASAIAFERVVADPEPLVRKEALERWKSGALGTIQRAAWARAVLAVALSTPAERRMTAEAATIARDFDRLSLLAHDADPQTRALAVGALTKLHASTQAAGDEDPWVRAAAVDERSAATLLAHDPDPWVRRAALEQLVGDGQLTPEVRLLSARQAMTSRDGEVRSRAAALFTPEVCALPGSLEVALRLSLDERLDVRAAIASALEIWPQLDAALDQLLAGPLDDEVRISALTWRTRSGDRDALAALQHQPIGSLRVNAHLDALILVFPDEWVAQIPALEDRRPERRPKVTRPRPLAEVIAAPSMRALGKSGVHLSPLVVSGVNLVDPTAFEHAARAGCTAWFWEREYQGLTRFLRTRREHQTIIAGTYHSGPAAIRRDVESALRSLRTDHLDVYLLFWVRSPQRLDDDNFHALERLAEEGKLKTFGFSTHLRDVAAEAIARKPWPVVMTRFSAAHPAAARTLLPLAERNGTGVLAFSATCYGRLLSEATALECYQYALQAPAVSAVVSAPRYFRELEQNLGVLAGGKLSEERRAELEAHGERTHARNASFNALIRRADR